MFLSNLTLLLVSLLVGHLIMKQWLYHNSTYRQELSHARIWNVLTSCEAPPYFPAPLSPTRHAGLIPEVSPTKITLDYENYFNGSQVYHIFVIARAPCRLPFSLTCIPRKHPAWALRYLGSPQGGCISSCTPWYAPLGWNLARMVGCKRRKPMRNWTFAKAIGKINLHLNTVAPAKTVHQAPHKWEQYICSTVYNYDPSKVHLLRHFTQLTIWDYYSTLYFNALWHFCRCQIMYYLLISNPVRIIL